jgi:hypothetical protein
MAKERRKHERLAFCRRLAVNAGRAQPLEADACDLSAAGMSFRTSTLLGLGDKVQIHITGVMEHAAIAASVRRVIAHGRDYVIGVEHAPVG